MHSRMLTRTRDSFPLRGHSFPVRRRYIRCIVKSRVRLYSVRMKTGMKTKHSLFSKAFRPCILSNNVYCIVEYFAFHGYRNHFFSHNSLIGYKMYIDLYTWVCCCGAPFHHPSGPMLSCHIHIECEVSFIFVYKLLYQFSTSIDSDRSKYFATSVFPNTGLLLNLI